MLPLTTLASSPRLIPQDLGEKDLSSRSSLSQNQDTPLPLNLAWGFTSPETGHLHHLTHARQATRL